jgi:predicted alpha/beta hydrolase family esterase
LLAVTDVEGDEQIGALIARPGEPGLSLVERSVVGINLLRPFAKRPQEHHFDAMKTLEEVSIDDDIDPKGLNSSNDDIANRTRLLENEIRFTRRTCSDLTTTGHFNPAPDAEGIYTF